MKLNWTTEKLVNSQKLTGTIKLLTFSSSIKTPHIPGQYCSIKITDQDGFDSARDYSLTCKPNTFGKLEFAVQLIENGAVSPALHKLRKGDEVLIKGPLGTHFVLDQIKKNPLILIGAGSGIAPYISMLETLAHESSQRDVYFLASFRTKDEIPFFKQLTQIEKKLKSSKFFYTLTREQPTNWKGHFGRIDQLFLDNSLKNVSLDESDIYICGLANFVEDMKGILVQQGAKEESIFIEIFG